MRLEDIKESSIEPTHRYYFSGLDHKTADDFNRAAGRKVLYPYSGGYYAIRYNRSGRPFFKLVDQLSRIFGDPVIRPF